MTGKEGDGLASPNGMYEEDLGVPETPDVFGTNDALNPSGKGNFWKQGGWLSNKMDRIPGMHSLSRLHDYYQISLGHFASWARTAFNVPAMIPATVVNYGALFDREYGDPAKVCRVAG